MPKCKKQTPPSVPSTFPFEGLDGFLEQMTRARFAHKQRRNNHPRFPIGGGGTNPFNMSASSSSSSTSSYCPVTSSCETTKAAISASLSNWTRCPTGSSRSLQAPAWARVEELVKTLIPGLKYLEKFRENCARSRMAEQLQTAQTLALKNNITLDGYAEGRGSIATPPDSPALSATESDVGSLRSAGSGASSDPGGFEGLEETMVMLDDDSAVGSGSEDGDGDERVVRRGAGVSAYREFAPPAMGSHSHSHSHSNSASGSGMGDGSSSSASSGFYWECCQCGEGWWSVLTDRCRNATGGATCIGHERCEDCPIRPINTRLHTKPSNLTGLRKVRSIANLHQEVTDQDDGRPRESVTRLDRMMGMGGSAGPTKRDSFATTAGGIWTLKRRRSIEYSREVRERNGGLSMSFDEEEEEFVEKEDESPKEYSCGTCQKVFPSNAAVKKHQVVHEEKQHSCKDCNASFYLEKDLRRHRDSVHGTRPRFFCPEAGCPRAKEGNGFFRKDHLRQHIVHSHGSKGLDQIDAKPVPSTTEKEKDKPPLSLVTPNTPAPEKASTSQDVDGAQNNFEIPSPPPISTEYPSIPNASQGLAQLSEVQRQALDSHDNKLDQFSLEMINGLPVLVPKPPEEPKKDAISQETIFQNISPELLELLSSSSYSSSSSSNMDTPSTSSASSSSSPLPTPPTPPSALTQNHLQEKAATLGLQALAQLRPGLDANSPSLTQNLYPPIPPSAIPNSTSSPPPPTCKNIFCLLTLTQHLRHLQNPNLTTPETSKQLLLTQYDAFYAKATEAYTKLTTAAATSPRRSPAFKTFVCWLENVENVIDTGCEGLLQFLNGVIPEDLMTVYCMLHVSYAMSAAMTPGGKEFDGKEFAAAAGEWRGCLKGMVEVDGEFIAEVGDALNKKDGDTVSEQDLFDEIVGVMWDEMKEGMEFLEGVGWMDGVGVGGVGDGWDEGMLNLDLLGMWDLPEPGGINSAGDGAISGIGDMGVNMSMNMGMDVSPIAMPLDIGVDLSLSGIDFSSTPQSGLWGNEFDSNMLCEDILAGTDWSSSNSPPTTIDPTVFSSSNFSPETFNHPTPASTKPPSPMPTWERLAGGLVITSALKFLRELRETGIIFLSLCMHTCTTLFRTFFDRSTSPHPNPRPIPQINTAHRLQILTDATTALSLPDLPYLPRLLKAVRKPFLSGAILTLRDLEESILFFLKLYSPPPDLFLPLASFVITYLNVYYTGNGGVLGCQGLKDDVYGEVGYIARRVKEEGRWYAGLPLQKQVVTPPASVEMTSPTGLSDVSLGGSSGSSRGTKRVLAVETTGGGEKKRVRREKGVKFVEYKGPKRRRVVA